MVHELDVEEQACMRVDVIVRWVESQLIIETSYREEGV